MKQQCIIKILNLKENKKHSVQNLMEKLNQFFN